MSNQDAIGPDPEAGAAVDSWGVGLMMPPEVAPVDDVVPAPTTRPSPSLSSSW